jgi:hypothetical protein
LIENGYDPEPDLTVRSTWHEFIKSHWEVLAACDFFTIELLVGRKLVRCTVFFVLEVATRKVFVTPVRLHPAGAYMRQVAKILTDVEDGFLWKTVFNAGGRGYKGTTVAIRSRLPSIVIGHRSALSAIHCITGIPA